MRAGHGNHSDSGPTTNKECGYTQSTASLSHGSQNVAYACDSLEITELARLTSRSRYLTHSDVHAPQQHQGTERKQFHRLHCNCFVGSLYVSLRALEHIILRRRPRVSQACHGIKQLGTTGIKNSSPTCHLRPSLWYFTSPEDFCVRPRWNSRDWVYSSSG